MSGGFNGVGAHHAEGEIGRADYFGERCSFNGVGAHHAEGVRFITTTVMPNGALQRSRRSSRRRSPSTSEGDTALGFRASTESALITPKEEARLASGGDLPFDASTESALITPKEIVVRIVSLAHGASFNGVGAHHAEGVTIDLVDPQRVYELQRSRRSSRRRSAVRVAIPLRRRAASTESALITPKEL